MKESKEDLLSGALKENVIEEGETKEEFTKMKSDKERRHEGKLEGQLMKCVEDFSITTGRRGYYDYMKESKEDMLSGEQKENVIEEGETKEELRKRDEKERSG